MISRYASGEVPEFGDMIASAVLRKKSTTGDRVMSTGENTVVGSLGMVKQTKDYVLIRRATVEEIARYKKRKPLI